MKLTTQEEYGLRCLLRVAQGDDGAPRAGGEVHLSAYHQRGGLEVELRLGPQVIGLETPGHFEVVEVAGVDLIERRVPRALQIRTIRSPFPVFAGGARATTLPGQGRRQDGDCAEDTGPQAQATEHAPRLSAHQ